MADEVDSFIHGANPSFIAFSPFLNIWLGGHSAFTLDDRHLVDVFNITLSIFSQRCLVVLAARAVPSIRILHFLSGSARSVEALGVLGGRPRKFVLQQMLYLSTSR